MVIRHLCELFYVLLRLLFFKKNIYSEIIVPTLIYLFNLMYFFLQELFNMDQNKNKLLENLRNQTIGYSIEYGNTTFKDSLEERIQAAKAASLSSKVTPKPTGKLFIPNRTWKRIPIYKIRLLKN